MANFEARIEANMLDDQTAEELAADAGWRETLWPEATGQAQAAGKTVTGDPEYVSYSKKSESPDGNFYEFLFNVPVA